LHGSRCHGLQGDQEEGKVTAFASPPASPIATLTYQRKKGKKFKSAGSQHKIAVVGEEHDQAKEAQKRALTRSRSGSSIRPGMSPAPKS